MENLQKEDLERKLCDGEQRNPCPLPPHSLLPSSLKWQLSPHMSSYKNHTISACHQAWNCADYGPSSSRWVHVTTGSIRGPAPCTWPMAPCTEPWEQILNHGVCTFLASASRTQKAHQEKPLSLEADADPLLGRHPLAVCPRPSSLGWLSQHGAHLCGHCQEAGGERGQTRGPEPPSRVGSAALGWYQTAPGRQDRALPAKATDRRPRGC